jgi:UDP-N-acetylenolpyruvoylglucosamine reductase
MASDVLALMELTQERVHAHSGMRLEPEIRIIGE